MTVGPEDVKHAGHCETWQEFLCVSTAIYLGAAAAALAIVRGRRRSRPRDDPLRREGTEGVTKPLPDEYAGILRAAEAAGIWKSGEDYLVPNRRPGAVKRERASDKVIWETVKKVAAASGRQSPLTRSELRSPCSSMRPTPIS